MRSVSRTGIGIGKRKSFGKKLVLLYSHHACVTCQRRKLEILNSPDVRIRISGSENERQRERKKTFQGVVHIQLTG